MNILLIFCITSSFYRLPLRQRDAVITSVRPTLFHAVAVLGSICVPLPDPVSSPLEFVELGCDQTIAELIVFIREEERIAIVSPLVGSSCV